LIETLIELDNVVVNRGRRTVLKVDKLGIEKGEILAVIGPNGSGKSTLLQVLAFLLPVTAGSISLAGQSASSSRPSLDLRRRVAVVFQTPLLIDSTVYNNVALGLRFRRAGRAETRARVERWLDRLGILHLRDRQARELSGGEAQRVSLARALAIQPDVLLLDEPLAALDAPTKADLLSDLEGVLRESGITSVFVTHDRNEALAIGDRIAVLIDGVVAQVGSPEEVFNSPTSEEVASFVGVETIAHGLVESQSEGLSTVDVNGTHVQVCGDREIGDRVVLFLRPEDVVLSLRQGSNISSSMRNNLPGVVSRLSPLGSQYRVVVDCGFPVASLITKQSRLDLDLSVGAEVVASFKATAVHAIRRSEKQAGLSRTVT
jgi:tungstate transport system ATP-binding protein